MSLTEYLVDILGLDEAEFVLGEPAFTFSFEDFEENDYE